MDVGLTSWSQRKRMVAPGKYAEMTPWKGLTLTPFVPLAEQMQYKYLLYVEGHCAANRYSTLMHMEAVIFKVESTCEAHQLWFFPMLTPFQDHIPIKEDLSDLVEKV